MTSFLINPYRFGAAATDPNFANVSLLLHGDASPLVDSSGTPKTITAFGNAAYSTAQAKFGSGSIAFDGTGDYLQSPANSGFDFGSGDFTMELWVRCTSAADFGGLLGIGAQSTIDASFFSLEFQSTQNSISFYVGAVSSYILTGTSSIRTSAAWTHVAVCRSGNNTRLFVNGTQEGSTYTSGYTITANSRPLWIGGSPFLNTINGYIDDLRITKGVARYTANFTPPTAPFPDS